MANSTFKNRLVGTLIVLAIAVIFLPDFFSRAVDRQAQEFRATPVRPNVEQVMSTPSFPNDFTVAETSSVEPIAVPITEDQIEMRELPESVDIGTTPNQVNEETEMSDAWVIQLGAFRNQESVEALLTELSDAGYTAYSRVYQRESGELHLVLVGPDLSKEKLEQQLVPLKELTRLEGKVMPYRPAAN